ncbi:diguanylate cyclase domain-containing protein [Actinoplanes sp. NPDC020271]|uniref:diguanylate cyclase domain-containing protein n=1 Tax=Actinoplanes sp. NPDC020271 TaxID=3363896 RepID=UPI0037B1B142
MRREWLSLPSRTVNRTRLAAVGIGSLAMLMQLGQIGNGMRSVAYGRVAATAIVTLVVLIVVVHRRQRTSWWTVPLVPVLAAVGAAGLKDPLAGTSLAMATLIVCSLYDTNRRWFARMAAALVAVPAAVLISPDVAAQATTWHSPTVLGILPQILLMGVLTRAFYLGLLRQEHAATRDAVLTRAGHELLAATEGTEIRRIGERTAAQLVRIHPGVALAIVARDEQGLFVAFAEGAPEGLAGQRLTGPAESSALIPGYQNWYVDPLGGEPETAPVLMVVGGRRRVPAEVRDAFRSLSYQVILAEEAHQARAELEYRAHHDHLTGLPTRAKFLRAADAAIEAGGPVALLNIDLDGFKRVNDEHGHAAGDELLVAVAGRIAAAAGRDGVAARFGGDEFALLLTGSTGVDQARRLCAELGEPVALTAATVRVGASIGVAFAEPGITVADLLRRADQAMYAAKAGGKNRVIRYGVTETVAA